MRSILRRSGLLARDAAGGFTLVELAVVIAIVALILGALLTPLATQQQMRRNKEAERDLREIKEALIGFAIANGRLPCPDTDLLPDGLENPFPSLPPPCPASEGLLPWQTLGTIPTDPWGRIYRYRVSPEFTVLVQTGQPAGAPPGVPNGQFDLFDVGTIRINTRRDDKTYIVLTTDAAAAVVSLGSNGSGGVRLDATIIPQAPAGTDERVNSDGANPVPPTAHFYGRQITLPVSGACSDTLAGPFCEFDDLVTWIPRVVLINRMVQAGRLP